MNNGSRFAGRSCLVLAAAVLSLAGCDAQEPSAAEAEVMNDAPQDPASRARENSDEGAAALAVSDKGVDEEGEKTWKQEALDFYDYQKNPRNRTFEMPRQWAIDLTKKLYAAGAEKVWVTRIDATDFGNGNVIHMSDDLLIVLPAEPAKRKAVFEAYHAAVEDEELKHPDVGQKYIHVVAD